MLCIDVIEKADWDLTNKVKGLESAYYFSFLV